MIPRRFILKLIPPDTVIGGKKQKNFGMRNSKEKKIKLKTDMRFSLMWLSMLFFSSPRFWCWFIQLFFLPFCAHFYCIHIFFSSFHLRYFTFLLLPPCAMAVLGFYSLVLFGPPSSWSCLLGGFSRTLYRRKFLYVYKF